MDGGNQEWIKPPLSQFCAPNFLPCAAPANRRGKRLKTRSGRTFSGGRQLLKVALGRFIPITILASPMGASMKFRALSVFASAILLSHSSLSLAVDPSDVRQPVTLTPTEYSWLLNEMRGHLNAIGAAQQALSTGDAEAARQAMLDRGTAHLKAPGRLSFPQKVPDAWKAMALAMHQSFDAVAEGIAKKESAAQTMGRTATLMQYCTGCHASYRLVEAPR